MLSLKVGQIEHSVSVSANTLNTYEASVTNLTKTPPNLLFTETFCLLESCLKKCFCYFAEKSVGIKSYVSVKQTLKLAPAVDFQLSVR